VNVTEEEIALFNDSLERCAASADFLDDFYRTFMASSPEVAAKFQRTDFKKQKVMLKTSFYMMMLAALGKPEGQAHLERIAQVHSGKDRDIRPGLYDLWLDCLIETARKFDRGFDEGTESAWRAMMKPGIAFMKARY
jgi:hemoglobin-like flavoprotein